MSAFFANLANQKDNTLVSLALSGEDRAFTALYDRYKPRLMRFARGKISDGERVEELIQEAFIRVHRHLARFDLNLKFSTWVYAITKNLVKNELRYRSLHPLVYFEQLERKRKDDDRPLEWADDRGGPDAEFNSRQRIHAAHAAVDKLSENHRRALVLCDFKGHTYDEISEITGVTLGTVKTRIHRARAAFAIYVEPLLD